ncbi:MAG: hypothetical protein FRX49_04147 [Trebouxia sp. A1-2]|nr:MAG: hypothetical protein FRX49_04147 [Trebouxia sp. A1-2]
MLAYLIEQANSICELSIAQEPEEGQQQALEVGPPLVAGSQQQLGHQVAGADEAQEHAVVGAAVEVPTVQADVGVHSHKVEKARAHGHAAGLPCQAVAHRQVEGGMIAREADLEEAISLQLEDKLVVHLVGWLVFAEACPLIKQDNHPISQTRGGVEQVSCCDDRVPNQAGAHKMDSQLPMGPGMAANLLYRGHRLAAANGSMSSSCSTRDASKVLIHLLLGRVQVARLGLQAVRQMHWKAAMQLRLVKERLVATLSLGSVVVLLDQTLINLSDGFFCGCLLKDDLTCTYCSSIAASSPCAKRERRRLVRLVRRGSLQAMVTLRSTTGVMISTMAWSTAMGTKRFSCSRSAMGAKAGGSRHPRWGSGGPSRRGWWLSRTGRRLVSAKVLVVHRLPLVTGQSVAGCHITGLHVILAAEHGLNLKLEVELEVVQGIDFSRQAEDALHPGVAGLEDLGVLAVLQDAVDEGQHGNHPALLVGLVQQALQVQILVADDLVLFDREVAQPVSQALLGSSKPAAFKELELADPTGVLVGVVLALFIPASAAAPLPGAPGWPWTCLAAGGFVGPASLDGDTAWSSASGLPASAMGSILTSCPPGALPLPFPICHALTWTRGTIPTAAIPSKGTPSVLPFVFSWLEGKVAVGFSCIGAGQ